VQHVFLRHAGGEPLAFKGGTCLRVAYGNPRHSEDLDFHAETDAERVLAHLDTATGRLADYGLPAEVNRRPSRAGLHAVLRYQGPLFDGSARSRGGVRIEVSLREEPVAVEEVFVPRTPYADVPQLVLRALTREHLLAEKVRALLVRAKARDLFDVHFLVERGVRCPRSLLDAKMRVYRRRFSLAALDRGVRSAGLSWSDDLEPLLGQVPPLRPVAASVREAFRHLPGA